MLGISGPGNKSVARKKDKALCISWSGRASFAFAWERSHPDVGAPGGAPDGPTAFCRNPDGPSMGFLFPPILFARNTLASGPGNSWNSTKLTSPYRKV